jgi:hypothetical protein
LLAYLAIVFQVRPTPGEFDEYPPDSHGDTGGDFNHPRLPGAGMPFSQRVAATPAVVVLATFSAGEGVLVQQFFREHLSTPFGRHSEPAEDRCEALP